MQSTITLTITTGKLSGKQYIFDSCTTCLIGRNDVPILQRNENIPKKLAQVIDLALIEKPQIYFDSAGKFKEALIKI